MTDHKPLTDEELTELEPDESDLEVGGVFLALPQYRRLLSELRSLRAEKADLRAEKVDSWAGTANEHAEYLAGLRAERDALLAEKARRSPCQTCGA